MPTTPSYIRQVNDNQTKGQPNAYPVNQQANEYPMNQQFYPYQTDQQPYGYQMNGEVVARGGGNFPPASSVLSNADYGSLEQYDLRQFDNNATNNAANNAQGYETSHTIPRLLDGSYQSFHFNSQATAALMAEESALMAEGSALMPEEYNQVSQNAYYSHDANYTPYNQAPQSADQTDGMRSFWSLPNDEQSEVEPNQLSEDALLQSGETFNMVDLQTQQPANPHASRPGDFETSQPRDYQTLQLEDDQPPQLRNWFNVP